MKVCDISKRYQKFSTEDFKLFKSECSVKNIAAEKIKTKVREKLMKAGRF
jgi:hypothetical protein